MTLKYFVQDLTKDNLLACGMVQSFRYKIAVFIFFKVPLSSEKTKTNFFHFKNWFIDGRPWLFFERI